MKLAERFIALLIMIEDIFFSLFSLVSLVVLVSLASLVSLEIAHGLGVYSIIALLKPFFTIECYILYHF